MHLRSYVHNNVANLSVFMQKQEQKNDKKQTNKNTISKQFCGHICIMNIIYFSCSCFTEFNNLVAKRNKLLGKLRILSLFLNSFIEFNKTWTLM